MNFKTNSTDEGFLEKKETAVRKGGSRNSPRKKRIKEE